MDAVSGQAFDRRAAVAAQVLAGTVIAVACVVLVGWTAGVESLKAGIPGLVTMKPMTATSFLLCGAGAWLATGAGGWKLAGRVLGAVVAGFSTVVLAEYFTGWSAGVDLLLFADAVGAENQRYPGRMAALTAFNFVGCGLAIAIGRHLAVRGLRLMDMLALTVFIGGLMPAIGYLLQQQQMYRALGGTTIALPTAVLFVLVGGSTLLVAPREGLLGLLFSRYSGGWVLRRVLPLVLLIASMPMWLGAAGTYSELFGTEQAQAMLATFNSAGAALVVALIVAPLNRHQALQERLAAEATQAAQLRVEREAAQQVERTKDRFMATMSHEIRTPLNAVLGMGGLLADTSLTPEQRDYVQTLRVNGEHLMVLVDQILDFSSIQAGALELESRDFDLAKCLDDSVGMVSDWAAATGLELTCEVAPGTPPTLRGDRARLRQILGNLLLNAVKFTPQGSVKLSVSAQPRDNGEFQFRFIVQDTGIGIAADLIPQLFKPFVQADDSATRRFGGTGIGLSISKRLAELMGGTLYVESEEGKGSTFTLEIRQPAGAPSPRSGPGPDPTTDALPAPMPARPAPADGPGIRILLAEDLEDNVKLAVLLLRKLGYPNVDVVGNGAEAVAAVERGDYDLVLMDVMMPVMDGLEATREICRRHPPERRPRIIAVTAKAMPGDREQCLAAGMDDYIAKPVRVAQLRDALERQLQKEQVAAK